jgi:hypothetical protein
LTSISNPEDAVLPSSKRPARFYQPTQELVRNDEREDVYSSVDEAVRVRVRDSHDEDPTLLFAGSTHSILPPRSDTPIPEPEVGKTPRVPSLRGAMRIATPKPDSMRGALLPRPDDEDRTILRPVPEEHRSSRPSAPPSGPFRGKAKRAAERRSERISDVGDPPSAVITAKRRSVVPRGSKKSLAAALLTLGVFVGLVTAVVARGDADSLLDATARLVDPSHASAAGRGRAGAAQASMLPLVVDTTQKTAPLGSDQNPAPGACLPPSETVPTTPPVVISAPPPPASARAIASAKSPSPGAAEPSAGAAKPSAPKSAPVAAAPARSSPRASSSGGAVTSSASGNAHERAAKASKLAQSSPDYEGAAAADALAKAQLEASLR